MGEDREQKGSPAHAVDVGGVTIAARNVTDAAALSLAGELLNKVQPQDRQPELVQTLATLLESYGLHRQADALRERYIKQ